MRRGRVRRHACATDAERKAWKAAGPRKALAALHEMGEGMLAAPDMRAALLEVLGVRLADYDGGGSADDLCVSLMPPEPRPARSRLLASCSRQYGAHGTRAGQQRRRVAARRAKAAARQVRRSGQKASGCHIGNGRATERAMTAAGTCGLEPCGGAAGARASGKATGGAAVMV